MIDEKELRLRHAKSLLQQIDQVQEQSGFWTVSAISNLATSYPDMTIRELMQIIAQEMPQTSSQYLNYLRNT